MNVIQQLEQEEAQRLAALRKTPDFQPADEARYSEKAVEADHHPKESRLRAPVSLQIVVWISLAGLEAAANPPREDR